MEEVCIVGVSYDPSSSQTEQLVNLLPADTIIILEEPVDIADVADVFLSRVDDPRGLYPWKAIYKAMSKFSRLEISRFAGAGKGKHISLDVSSAQEFEHKAGATWKSNKAVLEELVSERDEHDVLLYCENAAEIKRVTEIIQCCRYRVNYIPGALTCVVSNDVVQIFFAEHLALGIKSFPDAVRADNDDLTRLDGTLKLFVGSVLGNTEG